MTKFQRNQPVVEAIQWDGTIDGGVEVHGFVSAHLGRQVMAKIVTESDNNGQFYSHMSFDQRGLTERGSMRPLCWLIYEENGNWEVLPPAIFKKYYSEIT